MFHKMQSSKIGAQALTRFIALWFEYSMMVWIKLEPYGVFVNLIPFQRWDSGSKGPTVEKEIGATTVPFAVIVDNTSIS